MENLFCALLISSYGFCACLHPTFQQNMVMMFYTLYIYGTVHTVLTSDTWSLQSLIPCSLDLNYWSSWRWGVEGDILSPSCKRKFFVNLLKYEANSFGSEMMNPHPFRTSFQKEKYASKFFGPGMAPPPPLLRFSKNSDYFGKQYNATNHKSFKSHHKFILLFSCSQLPLLVVDKAHHLSSE